jgi:hypothetical protein
MIEMLKIRSQTKLLKLLTLQRMMEKLKIRRTCENAVTTSVRKEVRYHPRVQNQKMVARRFNPHEKLAEVSHISSADIHVVTHPVSEGVPCTLQVRPDQL